MVTAAVVLMLAVSVIKRLLLYNSRDSLLPCSLVFPLSCSHTGSCGGGGGGVRPDRPVCFSLSPPMNQEVSERLFSSFHSLRRRKRITGWNERFFLSLFPRLLFTLPSAFSSPCFLFSFSQFYCFVFKARVFKMKTNSHVWIVKTIMFECWCESAASPGNKPLDQSCAASD